jgi:DNA-binding NarL/FixJ family response regulator
MNIWQAGAQMTPEQAFNYALRDAGQPAHAGGLLTARDMQIVTLVTRALQKKQIAEQLVVSPRPVDGSCRTHSE